MKRRTFVQNIGLGSLAFPLSSFSDKIDFSGNKSSDLLIPKALETGQTIGIVSPASAIFETEPFEIAKESFEALGLKVKFGSHVKNRYGHLAGSDEERAEELNEMFRDPEVNAIISLKRG